MMRSGPITYVNYDSLRAYQQLERVVSVTSAYTVKYDNDFILVDTTGGAVTITLPLARNGVHFTIIRVAGANNVTVARSGSDTIDGGTSATISASYTPYTYKDFSPTIAGYLRIA